MEERIFALVGRLEADGQQVHLRYHAEKGFTVVSRKPSCLGRLGGAVQLDGEHSAAPGLVAAGGAHARAGKGLS